MHHQGKPLHHGLLQSLQLLLQVNGCHRGYLHDSWKPSSIAYLHSHMHVQMLLDQTCCQHDWQQFDDRHLVLVRVGAKARDWNCALCP